MKFLLAVDGSESSGRAVSYLATHMDLFKEQPQLLLVNVHAPITSTRVRSYVGKETLEKYYDEECESALLPARAMLDAKGIKYTPVKLIGEVGIKLAQHALEQGCAMLVMGTHGHGAIGNLVMGSVANRVVAESKIPVLLIK